MNGQGEADQGRRLRNDHRHALAHPPAALRRAPRVDQERHSPRDPSEIQSAGKASPRIRQL